MQSAVAGGVAGGGGVAVVGGVVGAVAVAALVAVVDKLFGCHGDQNQLEVTMLKRRSFPTG